LLRPAQLPALLLLLLLLLLPLLPSSWCCHIQHTF
jgi:hypothetical protein